ncbi:competence-stimulating peptide ComC [Streptococcus sp. NM]|nr:competence-stimulating peptide ComC [Streptococcus sp. NM]REK92301.1 competence-stimulating peptide ComC [Streptococcus sp. NM]
MKNTVKLEQFLDLKEKDLQEIRGGDSRISKYLRDFIFPRKK